MVPKMQTSVGIACFESYHSRSRLLLRSAASLLQTLSLPLPGALSSSRLSPPPRLPSLSPSLVLRPPLTVTGWLVDWLFLGGGREREGGRLPPAPRSLLVAAAAARAASASWLTFSPFICKQGSLASSRSSLSPSARLFPFASLRSCRWRTARPRPSLRRPRRWKEN